MVKKRINHWIDGDSGVFADGTHFRLANVRAPERGRRGAETATRSAAGMTGQSDGYVNVQVVGSSHGRKVVRMRNSDGSINNRMRRRGYTNQGR